MYILGDLRYTMRQERRRELPLKTMIDILDGALCTIYRILRRDCGATLCPWKKPLVEALVGQALKLLGNIKIEAFCFIQLSNLGNRVALKEWWHLGRLEHDTSMAAKRSTSTGAISGS